MTKILIDCTSLSRKKTGIENYTEQLCIALKPMLYENGFKPVFLFSHNKPTWLNEEDEHVIYKGNSTIVLNVFWTPLQLFKIAPVMALFPAFPPSPLVYWLQKRFGIKIIKIVYDAALWLYPDTLPFKNKVYFKPLESFGISKYDKIATISNSSLSDLVEVFPSVQNKITSIGTSLITRDVVFDVFQPDLDIKNEFFLFVGTVDTRKNISVALQAFSEFLCKYPDIKFVIAGRSAWGSKSLGETIKKYKLENNVELVGYVDDALLNVLYKKALAFVFPSVYEGYGLPIIEAMSHGCPVIASNNSSIPEAAGGAALLVNDYTKASSWLKAFNEIYDTPNLRKDLILRGRIRIKNMSWNDVAKKMLGLVADLTRKR